MSAAKIYSLYGTEFKPCGKALMGCGHRLHLEHATTGATLINNTDMSAQRAARHHRLQARVQSL